MELQVENRDALAVLPEADGWVKVNMGEINENSTGDSDRH